LNRRCDRNRKRSKRRSICCPLHGCFIDSVSQKHRLFADQAEQLQERGISRRTALTLLAGRSTVGLEHEWLEAFWCAQCNMKQWFHVRLLQDRSYELTVAPTELWQQVSGVMDPKGNPSVGEFTRHQSRMIRYQAINQFNFVL
jgi:hypothetical protein